MYMIHDINVRKNETTEYWLFIKWQALSYAFYIYLA